MKPIHPIFVHFPLALLPMAVAADLIGFFAGIDSLRHTGWWAIFGASMGAVLTVAAGFFDMYRATLSEEVHKRVHRHRLFGLILLAAIIGLTIWRGMLFYAGDRVVPMLYLDLAVLTVALALFQGWLGGELVYGDGVFVQEKMQKKAAADEGGKPAAGKTAAGGHHH